MENPESPKRRGWSFLLPFQIIGALTGASLTLLLLMVPPDVDANPNDYSRWILLGLVSLPSTPFFMIYGMFRAELTLNAEGGSWSMPVLSLLVATNAVSYALIGTFIGWAIRKLITKR